MEADTLVLSYELAAANFMYDPDTGEFLRVNKEDLGKQDMKKMLIYGCACTARSTLHIE
ncbi:hypothetical protein [Pseudomonas paraeruginosa]|uniref:hypothetical protein n=1 Tax=Pseudomonas paraeruginosa TaxID=2994495 RepID=UPI0039FBDC2B